MLDQESLANIHVLHRQAYSIRGISRKLGVSRNTVRTYLRKRIEAAKPCWIPATVLFRELQTQGYDGQEGLVKIYVRQFKPITNEPLVRLKPRQANSCMLTLRRLNAAETSNTAYLNTLRY
jgi:transposase